MLDYVQRGQKLKIPAQDYNAMIDAAKMARKKYRNVPIIPPRMLDRTSTVWIKNNTGEDVPFGGILRIGDSISDPLQDDELGLFQERIFVSGLKPNSDDDAWVVALEPIPKTMCGRAMAAGCVQCRVDVQSEDDKWAYSTNGQFYLTGTALDDADQKASAEIIYKSQGSGLCWCLVRFPLGPVERIEIVIPPIECNEQGGLEYDTKHIWVSRVEPNEGSGS